MKMMLFLLTLSVASVSLFGQAAGLVPHHMSVPDATGGGPGPSPGGPVLRELFIETLSNTPGAGTVVMGSTGNTLFVALFTTVFQNANLENTTVRQFAVCESTTANQASFTNLSVWNGPVKLGVALDPQPSSTPLCHGYIYEFVGLSLPAIVPPERSIALTFKGDVIYAAAQDAQDNGIFQFQILDQSSIIAWGSISNIPLTVHAIAQGNPIKIVRTTMAVNSGSPGKITFTALSSDEPADLVSLSLAFYLPNGQPAASLDPTQIRLLYDGWEDIVQFGWASVVVEGNTMSWVFDYPNESITVSLGYPFSLELISLGAPSGSFPYIVKILESKSVLYADGFDQSATVGLNGFGCFPVVIWGTPNTICQ